MCGSRYQCDFPRRFFRKILRKYSGKFTAVYGAGFERLFFQTSCVSDAGLTVLSHFDLCLRTRPPNGVAPGPFQGFRRRGSHDSTSRRSGNTSNVEVDHIGFGDLEPIIVAAHLVRREGLNTKMDSVFTLDYSC